MRARLPQLLLGVAVVVVALDQATKARALATLTPGRSEPAIDGVLHWTLQRNPGAAFGIFQQFPLVFTILAVVISAWILSRLRTIPDRATAWALGLVLGGAVGNLCDRVFRDPAPFRGHVVDFIDLRVWPVFNIADSAVVSGAVLLVVASFVQDRREARARAAAGGADGIRDGAGTQDAEAGRSGHARAANGETGRLPPDED